MTVVAIAAGPEKEKKETRRIIIRRSGSIMEFKLIWKNKGRSSSRRNNGYSKLPIFPVLLADNGH